MDVRVISIGALAANPLWNEKEPVRTGHATTSLIRARDKVILVDPGLPEPAVAARLTERSGLRVGDVTHVFLTSFQPDTRRGIMAFEGATWWVSQAERESVGVPLIGELQRVTQESGDDELIAALELDVAILRRCEPAPDRLADGVDLFPLHGVTAGLTGLIVSESQQTTLVCGDAIATNEHLERGQVLSRCADVDKARESFAEAIEIADRLILGRDNWVRSPTRGGM
jgi:glyoxylase-like metal-dependent hydrolase (beta-lactamase superfamily II)